LSDRDVETLDPMRAKSALSGQARISLNFNDYAHNGPFFTSRGIMTRDFNDVKRCDALLVNLLGLVKPSLGTIMELAWAYAMQKPAVVAIEKTGNPHDNHPMIHEAMPFRVDSLDEAIHAVAVILGR
jgi:nucleoside 2-deoxyribosyltransferase